MLLHSSWRQLEGSPATSNVLHSKEKPLILFRLKSQRSIHAVMFVLKTFLSSYGFPLSVVRLGFNAKSHLYITQHGIFWKEYSKEDSPSLASRGEKERHRGGEVVDTEQINAKETAAEWRVNTTRVQTNRETSLTPTVPDTCLVCTASRLRPAPDLRDTHTYTWGSVCWFEVLAGTCRNSLHFLLFHCTSWCLQRNRKNLQLDQRSSVPLQASQNDFTPCFSLVHGCHP